MILTYFYLLTDYCGEFVDQTRRQLQRQASGHCWCW